MHLVELLEQLGLKRAKGRRSYAFDESLAAEVVELAKLEQVPEEEMATELMAMAISLRKTDGLIKEQWEILSEREKDVTALTCLGYTNRMIASKLKLSPATVNGYVRQVLIKFNFHGKSDMQSRLEMWDFSNWGPKTQD